MESLLHYADVDTPTPGVEWTSTNERNRLDLAIERLQMSPEDFLSRIQVVAARVDGQIVVQMKEPLPANYRGPFLLDLEEYLKAHIDDALTVWLEPLGDRNSLRNLRGIEVKSS